MYFCSLATLGSPLIVCMPPAACQVEPEVSSDALDQHHVGPAELRQVVEDRSNRQRRRR